MIKNEASVDESEDSSLSSGQAEYRVEIQTDALCFSVTSP